MPREKHLGHAGEHARGAHRHTGPSRRRGSELSAEDCHERVARLKAQAECLEQILDDIRGEIDALECEETLERIQEELLEATE